MQHVTAEAPVLAEGYRFPAGPRKKPLVGSTFDFSRDPLGFVTQLQRDYGDAATVPMLRRGKMVMLFSPMYVRYVLTEHPRIFTSREFNYSLERLLGDGLLSIDGDFHRSQRRLVQPAFHRKRIDSYAQTMTQHTEEMLATWQLGQTLDLAAEMQALTLRIVAKTLLSVDLQHDSNELARAFNDVILFPADVRLSWKTLLKIDSPLTPYGRFLRGKATLDRLIYGIIDERRQSGEDTGDVLSMLLASHDEDATVMTDKQVRDETMTFFAAGHETTSNALSWTFYLLSQYPGAYAKLRAELDRVLGGRMPTVDDLANLVYTDMVIKEAMRLYPPAWAIGRMASEDFTMGEYHLPKGQIVLMSQWVIQRRPDIWGPDAEHFKPERFDPLHPQEVPHFAYFPFGGGPRMCIGMPFAQMEARLLLATIAQRFHPRMVLGHPVVPQPMVTLRPKYGLKMTLGQ
ncbi:MAG: cytochrome P450 [Ktedonobacterales bacterium]|nr:cytochrome P450 [Ktedonobacterales bacterium]